MGRFGFSKCAFMLVHVCVLKYRAGMWVSVHVCLFFVFALSRFGLFNLSIPMCLVSNVLGLPH